MDQKANRVPSILYLAFVRMPTEKAHGLQIMKTCEALADSGVAVELYIPNRRTRIQGDTFSHYGSKRNFSLRFFNVPDFVRTGFLGFVVSALWFSEVVKWQKSFWRVDFVYSRDAILLLQYLFLGRRLVYEAHTKPTLISRIVARSAYKVVVISHGLKSVYLKLGVQESKIIVAPDAVDSEIFKKNFNKAEVCKKFGISTSKKIALYVGKIDVSKGVGVFAEAGERTNETLSYVVVGGGEMKDELKKKFPTTLFLPETPYTDLPELLSCADVLVIPNSAKDENTALYTSPLKAFAYLASGKQIVASDVPALREALMGQEGVHFFKPDDSDSLRGVLHSLNFNAPRTSRTVYSWNERAGDIRKIFD